MMYKNKLAVAVKSNSRVLRELQDKVFIPFGTEYSLLVKNLNNVKALVKISIDGQDIGSSFVVNPNNSIDIERFILNGNLNQGNKFKFIERTEEVSNHRGNKIDDGLIRFEFQFEKEVPKSIDTPKIWGKDIPTPYIYDNFSVFNHYINNIGDKDVDFKAIYSGAGIAATSVAPPSGKLRSISTSSATNEVGITVPGSVSDQKFVEASWFPTDGESHVMILHMVGEADGKQITEPITVKTKPTCVTCGKINPITSKFCSGCGTSLQIV